MSQTNAQLLADSLGTASTGTIPIGGIILWSGSTGSVPDGWRLCNGSNGTPNLQDRFVVGAGSGYAVGNTGGSANAVVVAHNHGLSGGSASGTFVTSVNTLREGRRSGSTFAVDSLTTNSASVSYTQPTVNNAGVSGTNANLPPYYALAYIMRTS
jgi:microcystin-dependent protein